MENLLRNNFDSVPQYEAGNKVHHLNLDESQVNTFTQQWLMENCWHYGFILRYPKDKSEITGIIFEPWHYRYVGKEHATIIKENGICLEEDIENMQNYYQVQ